MKFVELTEAQYQAFFDSYPNAHFWQSAEMAHMRADNGWKIEYVGIADNDEVKAAASLHSKAVYRGYRVYMILRGLLVDYDDREMLRFFLSELMQYLKEHKCLYVRMDPYAEYQKHLPDGSVEEGTEKNDSLIELLRSFGFEHLGFRNEIDNNYEPRWMSVLPLKGKSEAVLLKQMHSQTRQNVNNTIKTGIKVRELSYEELDILHHMVDVTGNRRHFEKPDLAYYQHFYREFKDHKKVLYAYLDTEDYRDRNEKELCELKKKEAELCTLLEENPQSQKNERRLRSTRDLIAAHEKRIREAKELLEKYGKEIPLAAALFVIYPMEVVYLFSGSDDTFKHFKGSYAIQWEIIRQTLQMGIPRYNFYGISGSFDENNEEYGVYLFKRGFNADVIELVGDFQCVTAPKIYRQYQLLHKIKDKITG